MLSPSRIQVILSRPQLIDCCVVGTVTMESKLQKTDTEMPKTLGHFTSINPNMIIHFANQSETCQLLKFLKTFFFQTFHEN